MLMFLVISFPSCLVRVAALQQILIKGDKKYMWKVIGLKYAIKKNMMAFLQSMKPRGDSAEMYEKQL